MTQMNASFLVARPWLLLACSALGFSAVLAVLLVLSRAPVVQDLFGLKALFQTILVLHVNFAVLVWLLSFIGFIWVYHLGSLRKSVNYFAFTLCVLGGVFMLISPFIGVAQPILSNYVPVINSPLFLMGLFCFALAISIIAMQVLLIRSWDVMRLSALVWFVVLLVLTYHLLQLSISGTILDARAFFEALFWGAGHVLQFVYVLMLWFVWRWPNPTLLTLQKNVLIAVLIVAIGVMLFLDPAGSQSRQAYTLLMQGGMFLLLLPMLWWWGKASKKNNTQRLAVAASVLLIALGLIIGLLIRDDSVIVTAHYHATNAAITVAFMGLSYHFIKKYSLNVISVKWYSIQIYLYTVGMVLYVLGMASSGWLGVPRKTAMMVDNPLERISMGIMGFGGALSIVATLLFIGFVFYAFLFCPRTETSKKSEGLI